MTLLKFWSGTPMLCVVMAICQSAIGAETRLSTFEEGAEADSISLSLEQAFPAALTPLVVDIQGSGLDLLARTDSGLILDIDGDGFAEPTGWVGASDGFLAKDLDGDGRLGKFEELFGLGVDSPWEELEDLDTNGDYVIDGNDRTFEMLRVWQDGNTDAKVGIDEVRTLPELGIEMILLNPAEPPARRVGGNQVKSQIGVRHKDIGRISISYVRLHIDNYASHYLGDKAVNAVAAAQPNVRGRGTLPDLHVAMTRDPLLLDVVSETMPTLTMHDLSALREAVKPILAAWAAPDTVLRSSIPLFVMDTIYGSAPRVLDFAVPNDDVIAAVPDEAYVLVLDGVFLGFFARLIGEQFSLEKIEVGDRSAATGLKPILAMIFDRLNVISARLALQGPLGARYFRSISYDTESDTFHPATEQQLRRSMRRFSAMLRRRVKPPLLILRIGSLSSGSSWPITSEAVATSEMQTTFYYRICLSPTRLSAMSVASLWLRWLRAWGYRKGTS